MEFELSLAPCHFFVLIHCANLVLKDGSRLQLESLHIVKVNGMMSSAIINESPALNSKNIGEG